MKKGMDGRFDSDPCNKPEIEGISNTGDGGVLDFFACGPRSQWKVAPKSTVIAGVDPGSWRETRASKLFAKNSPKSVKVHTKFQCI